MTIISLIFSILAIIMSLIACYVLLVVRRDQQQICDITCRNLRRLHASYNKVSEDILMIKSAMDTLHGRFDKVESDETEMDVLYKRLDKCDDYKKSADASFISIDKRLKKLEGGTDV